MEYPKKICSLGIFDITLNLELTQKEANKYNFNYDLFKSMNDLEIFFDEIINSKNNQMYYEILEHISLSSQSNLINTLLFINRAYKNKTFIEFIMPNQLHINESKKNFMKIFKYILDKNYFFIIENKINDIPSSIKFNIKIYKDKISKIIKFTKEFQLYERENINNKINETNNKENENELSLNDIDRQNILGKINYNFSASDYFILDLDEFNNPVWNNECYNNDNEMNFENYINLIPFLIYIINQNKKIKIITILSKNIFDDKKFLNKLKLYKEVIEISDIIFGYKENINYFFQIYNGIFNDSSNFNYNLDMNNFGNNLYGDNDYSKDLILYDKDKYRKNIPRISIIFNNFDYISIYIQSGINMNLDYIEILFINQPEKKYNINEFNTNNNFYFFIGGFLSRFIHNKSFKICSSAGQLLLHKIIKSKTTNYSNIDDYNIIVPNKKKIPFLQLNNNKLNPLKNYNNYNLSYKNSSTYKDNNENYFFKNNLNNLKKLGFIERNNIILKESNSQKMIIYRNKSNKFKTMNNMNNIKRKNNSTLNVFEKEQIKKRLIKNYFLPKMQRCSSARQIISNNKNYNDNNRKYNNNLNLIKINNKSTKNYYNNKEYIFENNNIHYKFSKSYKFHLNQK